MTIEIYPLNVFEANMMSWLTRDCINQTLNELTRKTDHNPGCDYVCIQTAYYLFLTVLTPFSLRNRRGRNQQRAEDACILRLTAEMCNHAEPENWVKPIRNHYVIVTYFIVPVSEPIAALLFNEQRYA